MNARSSFMDELDFTLELLRDKAQLVRSLRKLGYAQGEVGVKAVRSMCAEMEKLLIMLRKRVRGRLQPSALRRVVRRGSGRC